MIPRVGSSDRAREASLGRMGPALGAAAAATRIHQRRRAANSVERRARAPRYLLVPARLEQAMNALDTDGDASISASEWEEAIEYRRRRRNLRLDEDEACLGCFLQR